MPNLKPDGFQFAAHLMIPKAQHLDSLGREEFISFLVLGALVRKAVSAAVEFHRQLCRCAVEIQKVNATGVLAAEFEFAETPAAQQTPQTFLGFGGLGAELTGKLAGVGRAGAVLAVSWWVPPHPNLLPRGGEGVRQFRFGRLPAHEELGLDFAFQNVFHLRLHAFIHLDQRRPRAFESFAGNFLRGVKTHFAPNGDFARRVVEHVRRAFGESLRTATMLSR